MRSLSIKVAANGVVYASSSRIATIHTRASRAPRAPAKLAIILVTDRRRGERTTGHRSDRVVGSPPPPSRRGIPRVEDVGARRRPFSMRRRLCDSCDRSFDASGPSVDDEGAPYLSAFSPPTRAHERWYVQTHRSRRGSSSLGTRASSHIEHFRRARAKNIFSKGERVVRAEVSLDPTPPRRLSYRQPRRGRTTPGRNPTPGRSECSEPCIPPSRPPRTAASCPS